jgi:molybdate transport system regulatory protein
VARLTIRIDLASHEAIGPGKIRLLNRSFRSPVIETQLGGMRGGGAVLTDLGDDVIARYRAVERAAAKASALQLAALHAARAAAPTDQRGRGRGKATTGPRSRSPLTPRRARR